MRAYPSWVLWRYEDIGAKKPTKVPYSLSGKLANVNDPTTWATFDDTIKELDNSHINPSTIPYSGIGFVFSDRDPYCFIDLDDATGEPATTERQLKISKEFDSYSEVSPSGKGLHIIIKGSIPQGRRRSSIEIYSSQRYATMTGHVYNSSPIGDYNNLINQLWSQMGAGPASFVYTGNEPENCRR
jgi:primase-polymerase (primpol)-like protein